MRLSKKAQPGSQKACRAVIRQQTWLPRLGHASSSRSSEAGGNPSSLRPKGPLPPAAELWGSGSGSRRGENTARAEVARGVWAGLGSMSAALLRRGLELLAASEGEEGGPWAVGGWEGSGARPPTRSFPVCPHSPSCRARPGQGERGSGEADPEGEDEGRPGPETTELSEGKGAQVRAG